MSNVINLADRRKFIQTDDEDAPVEKLFSPDIQQGIANTRQWFLRSVADHQRLLARSKSFKPSKIPALENPALAPLLNLRFNNARLRDLFAPLRSRLHTSEYERLYRRFGINLRIGPMTDPRSAHFEFWAHLGDDPHFTERVRKAYERAGVDWIDAMVSAAVALRVQEDSPVYPLPVFEGLALIRIPRKPG